MIDLYRTLLNEWKNRKLPEVIDRGIDLSSYATIAPRKIIVISGFRRTGKTYLLFRLLRDLKKNTIYINFEDERIPLKTEFLTGLLPAIKQVCGEVEYIFLDEVHNVPNWSKWLRRTSDTENIRFFVTGSSSKMSSKEIPTELRGRFLEVKVFPLSFKEFLQFKGASFNLKELSANDKASILRYLEEYLEYGGLPEVVLTTEDKKIDMLRTYYNTVIRRDIIERFRIRNEESLKALLSLLLNSTQYTISKLYNTLKSLNYAVGKSTIQTFLSYMENSYFLHSVPVLSSKVKDQLQWARKVYFIDSGFVSQLSSKFSRNLGRLYENTVFLELKRRQAWAVDRDTFYWSNLQHEEVDFVVKQGLKVRQLIQVCYDLNDFDTKKREIRALIKASKDVECKDLLVINQDKEGKEIVEGRTIKYVPLWKWLLECSDPKETSRI